MHAVFALQIAVGVLTLDHDRRALETGLVAVEIVEHLEFKAVLVRPLHIHAVEHLRPVLRLGAARAGVEGQNRVAVVVFAGKERRESCLLHIGFEFTVALFELGQQARVVHLRSHVDQREQIVARGNELFVAVNFIVQLLGAHLVFLRALQIVPEAVLVRLELEAVQLLTGLLDLQRLEEVFKCFVHRKQLLLVGIVFDHSHGVLSPYFYPSLAEKVYHTHRAKARKIRLSGRKFPWKRPFFAFPAIKTKKPRFRVVDTTDLSAR